MHESMNCLRIGASALVVLAFSAAASVAQPGFEGSWLLDTARSTALPLGMEQRMTISRDGEALVVETSIVTDFADRIQDDRYDFDGAEHEVRSPGAGSGTRTATRDGDRAFRSTDHLQGTSGETTVGRAWQLSEDGDELTIGLTTNGFGGRIEVARVFTRGEHAPESAPARTQPRLFPVDLAVPVAPSPFLQEGKIQLVYEISLRNFRAGEVEWQRLEVLDDGGHTLGQFEGDNLQSILSRPGATPDLAQPRRIGAGMTAVAYLWLAVDGVAPKALRHRAVFTLPAGSSGTERVVESGLIPVGPPAPVLGPPARGSGWVVRWISNDSFHRRGLFPVDGRAQIAQRFAIDWNRYDGRGIEQRGDESDNTTYSVFGQDAIAVADGSVAKVIDGVPQNSPPNIAPGVGTDPERALGNCVVLELPGGLFATYAHLQPGSVQVKTGDRVRRGQPLGRVGNSGNTTGPHLHFHLATGPGLQGEGMPYVFESFERLGTETTDGDKPAWDPAASKPTTVHGELPPEHAIIAFP